MRARFQPPFVRRALFVVVALAVALPMLPASPAGAARDPLAQAEARVTATRRAADAAAQQYDAAQAQYGRLDGQIAAARQQLATTRARQHRLADLARARAVLAYERAPLPFDDLVAGNDALDAARRAEMLDRANAISNAAIDQLGAVTEDLHARESSLNAQLASQRQTVATLARQQTNLQHALSAALSAERDLRASLARAQKLRDYAAALAKARAAARPSSSGGSSGGSAGTILVSGDWVCPVQGPVSFTDTWGSPRSGGRTHKGVDMFAAEGTPVVAVESGSVFFQGDPLGGNAAYVQGHDGISYYYAHLRDYVGGARSVSAGELIGHVGHTGDADGGAPHLHFEIRPGGPGAPAVPPYPTVRAHC